MLKVITFEAIPILINGHDTQGQLVLADGELTAVLARLDGPLRRSDRGLDRARASPFLHARRRSRRSQPIEHQRTRANHEQLFVPFALVTRSDAASPIDWLSYRSRTEGQ